MSQGHISSTRKFDHHSQFFFGCSAMHSSYPCPPLTCVKLSPPAKQPPFPPALPPLLSTFSLLFSFFHKKKEKKKSRAYRKGDASLGGRARGMALLLTGPPHPQLASLHFHSKKLE